VSYVCQWAPCTIEPAVLVFWALVSEPLFLDLHVLQALRNGYGKVLLPNLCEPGFLDIATGSRGCNNPEAYDMTQQS
jgi:hypothetical protein